MDTVPATARVVLVVLTASALFACGESPTGAEGLAFGEFELTVSGSLDKSLRGGAAFADGKSTVADRRVWLLGLDKGRNELLLRLGTSSLVPQPGRYDLVPWPSDADTLADGKGFVSLDLIGEDSTRFIFGVQGGTLVIEESRSSEVRGHLTFATDSGSTLNLDQSIGPVSGEAIFSAQKDPRKTLDSRTLPASPVLP